MRLLLVAVMVIGVVFSCCDRTESVSDTGTVRFLALEGGFYGIIDDHDRRWDPTNLPQEYQIDSLRVRFEGIIIDAPTFHMWGRTVELRLIKRLH